MSIHPHELQRVVAALLVIKSMADKFDEEMLLSWKDEPEAVYGDPIQRFLDKKEVEKNEPVEEKKLRVGGCQVIYLADRRAGIKS